jgi:hypothetical protein
MEHLSAREYLEFLQAETAIRSGISARFVESDLASRESPAFIKSPVTPEEARQMEEFKARLSGETDFVAFSAKQLAEYLSVSTRSKLASIVVGTLPIPDFNAMAQSPSGEPLVIVTSGLFSLLHVTSEALVATVPLAGSPAELPITQGTLEAFRHLAAWLRQNTLLLPHTRFTVRSPTRRNMIGAISANGLNFVLAHEFAHVMLGHLKTDSKGAEGTHPLQLMERSHEQEYAADEKGFEMALEFSGAVHDGRKTAGVLGTAMVLHLLRAIEALDDVKSARATHPPAVDRLSTFERWVKPQADADSVDMLARMRKFMDALITAGAAVLKKLDGK